MKIAVTADVHLRPDRPERLAALAAILEDCRGRGAGQVIIPGDLFDAGQLGHGGFDELCRSNPDLVFHLIPGNHDPNLQPGLFRAANLRLYTEPTIADVGGRPMFFLPWRDRMTVAQAIDQSPQVGQLDGRCLLVTHGDVVGGERELGDEPEAYFPVSPQDAAAFGFPRIIIGHIHKPQAPYDGRFVYPGSPCPLSSKETGPRRYLLLEPSTGEWESVPVPGVTVYENIDVHLVPVPGADHRRETRDRIAAAARAMAARADGPPPPRVRPLVRFLGMTDTDLKELATAAEETARGAGFAAAAECDTTTRLEHRRLTELEASLVAEASARLERDYDTWPATAGRVPREEILAAAISLMLPPPKNKGGG